jgi:hypothetical protein
MHLAASDYIFKTFHQEREERFKNKKITVLEIGSFNINGGVRNFFAPFAKEYVGLDIQEGEGVDLVADAAEYVNKDYYDIIVTAETFEHTPDWKKIIANTYLNLKEGGLFIATMAGEGRPPHSALDEKPIRSWEHYANIGEWELTQCLQRCGFNMVSTVKNGSDLYCLAIKE